MFHDAGSQPSILCLSDKFLVLSCTLGPTVCLNQASFDGHVRMFSTLVPKLEFSSDNVES